MHVNTEDEALKVEPGWVKVMEAGDGKFTQHLLDGSHQLLADEPVDVGGNDRGPGPYQLLLMSLGACTTMTIRLYIERKKWPVTRIAVRLRHGRSHAQDCADCDTKNVRIEQIERIIEVEGTLDDDQRAQILEIAEKCPVHRTLTSGVRIRSSLS